MSKEKFTPGVWRVDDAPRRGFGGSSLPYLAIDCGGMETIHVCGNGTTFSKHDANLIAAAPDLYRALKEMVEHFGDPAGGKLFGARAALAKAEGGNDGL